MSKKGQDAKDMCELEGATIFYPEDQNEADAIRQLWNETQVVLPRIYIGVASWIVKGVFETFDGKSILTTRYLRISQHLEICYLMYLI